MLFLESEKLKIQPSNPFNSIHVHRAIGESQEKWEAALELSRPVAALQLDGVHHSGARGQGNTGGGVHGH